MQRTNLFSTTNNSSITPRSLDILVELINEAYLNEGHYRALCADQREKKVDDAYMNYMCKLTGLTTTEQFALKNEAIPLETGKTINDALNQSIATCLQKEGIVRLARVVLSYRPDNHQIKHSELITRAKKDAKTGQAIEIPIKQSAVSEQAVNSNTKNSI